MCRMDYYSNGLILVRNYEFEKYCRKSSSLIYSLSRNEMGAVQTPLQTALLRQCWGENIIIFGSHDSSITDFLFRSFVLLSTKISIFFSTNFNVKIVNRVTLEQGSMEHRVRRERQWQRTKINLTGIVTFKNMLCPHLRYECGSTNVRFSVWRGTFIIGFIIKIYWNLMKRPISLFFIHKSQLISGMLELLQIFHDKRNNVHKLWEKNFLHGFLEFDQVRDLTILSIALFVNQYF